MKLAKHEDHEDQHVRVADVPKSGGNLSSRWPPSRSNNTVAPHVYRGEQCAFQSRRKVPWQNMSRFPQLELCVMPGTHQGRLYIHRHGAPQLCSTIVPQLWLAHAVAARHSVAPTQLSTASQCETSAVASEGYNRWIRKVVQPIQYDQERAVLAHAGNRTELQHPEVVLMTQASPEKYVQNPLACSLVTVHTLSAASSDSAGRGGLRPCVDR